MSEIISSFAFGFIILTILTWVTFWVFVGYWVAVAVSEEPRTGMIYGAALGPLGVIMLFVGHFALSSAFDSGNEMNKGDFKNVKEVDIRSLDDPLL